MRGKEGVTLIEIMVVVAIVGLLAAIAIPAYDAYLTRTRRADAFTALMTVRAAQEMYRAERGLYAYAFVDAGVTVLAGCSINMALPNYAIAINRTSTTAYTATATPAPANQGGKQTKDFCFKIDQDNNQSYAPYTTACGTYQSRTFGDLR